MDWSVRGIEWVVGVVVLSWLGWGGDVVMHSFDIVGNMCWC